MTKGPKIYTLDHTDKTPCHTHPGPWYLMKWWRSNLVRIQSFSYPYLETDSFSQSYHVIWITWSIRKKHVIHQMFWSGLSDVLSDLVDVLRSIKHLPDVLLSFRCFIFKTSDSWKKSLVRLFQVFKKSDRRFMKVKHLTKNKTLVTKSSGMIKHLDSQKIWWIMRSDSVKGLSDVTSF